MSENTATADPMYRTKGEEYTPRASTTSTHDTRHDVVFQDIGHPIGEIGEPLSWTFSRFLQDARDRSEQQSEKHLALTWRDLTVKGVAASAAFGDDCWSYINPMETWRASRKQDGNQRTLINDFNGQLLPGQMMLVVGRPGSGCTTFLKSLANKRESFASISGEVFYGTLGHEEAARYRQQILFNSEEDIHFPTLAVGQMLKFALQNKVPRIREKGISKEEFVKTYQTSLLRALGILHTKKTLVGNEFVRGVSGGERKRVSIAEVLAGNSPIQMWDNSTRGLDASTALDFTQALRTLANKEKKTILATFYQAGNNIYNLFDKVLLIDEGHEMYYGPRELAQGYFEDMGFICPRGANIADFLASVSVVHERQIKPGYEHRVPTSPADFERVFRDSAIYRQNMEQIQGHEEFAVETEKFVATVKNEVQKSLLGKPSPYTVSLPAQVMACTMRQFQIIWGDRMSLGLRFAGALGQALINGSFFYMLPNSSASIFTRPGALFFTMIYFCTEAMSETTKSFMGRPILSRQKDFGLYRPTAYTIASGITDIPISILQVSLFSIIYYFMCNFQLDAGKFFIFWITLIVSMLCLNSFYRMIGALCTNFGDASKAAGIATMVFLVYGGYLIPMFRQKVWFRWISWINPVNYAFETLMVNEFNGRTMDCLGVQLIPNGESYSDSLYQACTVPGSNGLTIDGMEYLETAFGYRSGHMWRGFGVVIGWWLFYTFITAIGYERMKNTGRSAGLLYKRGIKTASNGRDEEKGCAIIHDTPSSNPSNQENNAGKPSGAVFAWKDIEYTVKVPGGTRKLLDRISGFVKPGQLLALMGSSGAGKTTLLDVLAQRKDSGVIQGSVTMDGRPLDESFQRSAGYCEQLDIHESSATVREALEFSALLRQPSTISDVDKLKYVDEIIELLELEDIQHALIGVTGAGLAVEQRKRVTIGVELVARPSILFLDEPTSGLDGASAFNVVRFMKKLARSGQAVVCTIHQPSASLFDNFDALLLLQRGGKTAYFGDTGEASEKVLDYFARGGAPCPDNINPAEHIVDVVQGRVLPGVDWHDRWVASLENTLTINEQSVIEDKCLAAPPSTVSDGLEFASTLKSQLKIVTYRHLVALWRKPDYIWNKIILHIMSALFSGFTFWRIGTSSNDLQMRLFAVFNILFVGMGVVNQLQPLFIANRDIFEAREKKSKTYSWIAFVTAQVVAEVPALIICGTLYFICFYFIVGFPIQASISGQIYFSLIIFELLYTAIGQAIAVYAPNEYFASLINPFILGALMVNFSGVLIPYSQLNIFWKYWAYYIDPYHYLIDSLLTQVLYAAPVKCLDSELSRFSPPSGQTCGEYMSDYFSSKSGYLTNSNATADCEFCQFSTGGDYAKTFNLMDNYYGWRGTGIMIIFVIASYLSVYGMMKLRSKKTKSAKAEE